MLCPLLYILSTAELALVVSRHETVTIQADDCQVYVSTTVDDTTAEVAQLTACLADVYAWLKDSHIRMHSTKTPITWLGSQQQLLRSML